MMRTATIALAVIYPRDEGRAVRPDRVSALAESIKELGLRTPITVRPTQKVKDGRLIDAYEIVCGQHRYNAALKLQWTEIACFIADDDALHLELWEIDENLARAELSPAEEAVYLKRRQQIWTAIHGETQVAKVSPPEIGNKKPPPQTRGFAADTAEKTGRHKSGINQKIRRAEQLGPAIEKVKGTSLDKGNELDALIKLPEKRREKLIEQASSGKAVSAVREVQAKKEQPTASVGQPVQARRTELDHLMIAWDNCSEEQRWAFLQSLPEQYKAGLAA